MQQPSLSCIQSRVEDDNSIYGRFLIGPFAVGQGVTLANALRRSLLSELSGLAITAVEIDGITHEYSSIQGIRDSVLDILLNIKQIRLTSNFPIFEPQTAYLQIRGPGIAVAKDIKLPNFIQCINPEQYIAGLSFDGFLRIKFYICRGKNYNLTHTNNFAPFATSHKKNKKQDHFFKVIKKKLNKETMCSRVIPLRRKLQFQEKNLSAQENFLVEESKKIKLKPLNHSAKEKILPEEELVQADTSSTQYEKLSKNEKRILLPINAVFAPVNRVNFLLETDDELKESRDRIILEIWTNGSIHPREAIYSAAQALIAIFSPFQEAQIFQHIFSPIPYDLNKVRKIEPIQRIKNLKNGDSNLKPRPISVKQQNLFLLDIANLELSLNLYTCLKRAGIETIGELLHYPSNDLLLLPNFRKSSFKELEITLNQIGFVFSPTNKKKQK